MTLRRRWLFLVHSARRARPFEEHADAAAEAIAGSHARAEACVAAVEPQMIPLELGGAASRLRRSADGTEACASIARVALRLEITDPAVRAARLGWISPRRDRVEE